MHQDPKSNKEEPFYTQTKKTSRSGEAEESKEVTTCFT